LELGLDVKPIEEYMWLAFPVIGILFALFLILLMVRECP